MGIGRWLDDARPMTSTAPPTPLVRPVDGRMVAGVCAGVARYLDLDVTVVRLVAVVLALVGGLGVPLYLAGYLLIPAEGETTTMASELLEQLRPERGARQ